MRPPCGGPGPRASPRLGRGEEEVATVAHYLCSPRLAGLRSEGRGATSKPTSKVSAAQELGHAQS